MWHYVNTEDFNAVIRMMKDCSFSAHHSVDIMPVPSTVQVQPIKCTMKSANENHAFHIQSLARRHSYISHSIGLSIILSVMMQPKNYYVPRDVCQ